MIYDSVNHAIGAFEFKARTYSSLLRTGYFIMTIAAKPAMNRQYFIQELVQRVKDASVIYEPGREVWNSTRLNAELLIGGISLSYCL